MSRPSTSPTRTQWLIAFVLAAAFVASHQSKAQAPPPPNPAKVAVDQRQAVYKLIGANFKPIGDVLQGRAPYDAAEIQKRATRVAFLVEIAHDAYPDVSKSGGGTKAKPEIWAQRADFDKRQQEFLRHTQTLAQVAAREKAATDAFKSAAGAVGQDCKGCHDTYRDK